MSHVQRFADRSSFEFSLDAGKSEAIVFGDERDYPYEWKLMGKTMKQVEEYTYLGLTMRRSLGRHLVAARSEKVRKEHVGFHFVDGEEERVINSAS